MRKILYQSEKTITQQYPKHKCSPKEIPTFLNLSFNKIFLSFLFLEYLLIIKELIIEIGLLLQ